MKITTNKNILTKKCEPIKDSEISGLIIKLYLAMNERKGVAWGVALNQIGIIKRGFVVYYNKKLKYYINPEIIKYDGGTFMNEESCLSLKGSYKVERYKSITVKDKRNGEQKLIGQEAIIFQHEYDHINGILIGENK
jgi:peptide deformylase